MMQELYKFLLGVLRDIDFLGSFAKPVTALAVILAILILARITHFLTKFLLTHIVQKIVLKTKTEWDDILLRNRVFNGIAHLVPAFVIYYSCFFATPHLDQPLKEMASEMASRLSADFYFGLGPILLKFAKLYFLYAIVYILAKVLNSCNEIYQTTPYAHHRPIKGYIQLLKIFIYFFSGIIVISVIIGKDPTVLIAGLGVMAGVLLLVFKDTILGFVASIQLSANDMLKVGDWIEMKAHNADGTVTDITLNTVKIQNWDKTITTVPTYALVSESFTNWRGMEESEGRRIKRSIFIDINSIRFCNDEMLRELEKFKLIREYVLNKEEEIRQSNSEKNIATDDLISGRRQTNLGIFRKYLELYLLKNETLNFNMTFIVRQLQSTDKGLPLEIQVFSKEKSWVLFEGIQSDIFDHIFATIPYFGLSVYQAPSGNDIRNAIKKIS
jgi:miniconductance mechanosensitive channel